MDRGTGPLFLRSADGAEDSRPGDRVSEYVLEERIGEGGCGTVWRARHAVLPGVAVAVKLPRDRRRIDLLRREGLLQHGLDHPGIVRVLGLDPDADPPYLVEELVVGGDLAALLAREGKIEPVRAMRILEEVAEVLRHAHGRGIIHRDLKPANILLDRSGKVRVTDFGLGKPLDGAGEAALILSLESGGAADSPAARRSAAGTWEYMAPEQKAAAIGAGRKGSIVDGRADLFSLGVILHEMLVGERPSGRVGLEHLSPEIDAIFARLYTSPDRRYRGAAELLADIRRWRKGKTVAAPAVPAGARVPVPAAPEPSFGRGMARVAGYILFPLAVISAVIVLAESVGAPLPRESRPAPAVLRLDPAVLRDPEEGVRLGKIRAAIERSPASMDAGLGLLAGFLATARDPVLVDRALRWKKAIESTRTAREYRVTLRRFQIDGEGYSHRFHSMFEPGWPDVYVRIWRVRDGRRELVYDGTERPVQAWGGSFAAASGTGGLPTFSLSWRFGEAIELEMRESDVVRDDVIANWRIDEGLAILLLSMPLAAPDGHVLELESDFGFGK